MRLSWIIFVCQQKNIVLKMPEAVPQFLQDSFSSLIPLVINVVIWHGLNTLLKAAVQMSLPAAIMTALARPLAGLNSWPGIFFLVFLAMLLWTFGLHGDTIVSTPILPIVISVITANAAHYAAGEPMEIAPVTLAVAMTAAGGTGNILSLTVLCMRGKSQQLRSVGRACFIPALFNINEPTVFGLPIMYNPILAIPFILNPLVLMLVLIPLMKAGIIYPQIIFAMTVLPIFMKDYMTTLHLGNLLLPIIAFAISFVIYLPFVRMYDRQLYEREVAEAAEAE